MRKKRRLGEELAERFELPPEAVSQAPRVTLSGCRRALVENHRGLLEYSRTVIEVGGDGVRVRILGDGLELRGMDDGAMVITGHILAAELEEGSGG